MRALRRCAHGHPTRVMLVALSLLGLVVRVTWVLVDHRYFPILDALSYYRQGLYLDRHYHLPRLREPGVTLGPHAIRWASAYWPPLYTMFQASADQLHHWLRFLGIDRIELTRLLQAVIGASAVGLMALIALRLFGRRVALVTGVLVALFPPCVFVCESFYAESLWVPLLIAAVAAVVEFRRTRRIRWIALAGVLTGLGTLTHSNGLYLLVPAVIAVWPRGAPRLAGRWRPLATYLVMFALTLTPWTVRNWVDLHHFVPVSTSFGNTVAGVYNNRARLSSLDPGGWVPVRSLAIYQPINHADHGDPNPAISDDRLALRALRYIEHHPTYPLVVAYWNTRRLLQAAGPSISAWYSREVGIGHHLSDLDMLTSWMVFLAALCACFTPGVRRGPKWIWSVPLVMYLGIVLIQSEVPRFRSPIDPFLCMLAACACVSAWERLAQIGLWRRPGLRGEYANT